MGMLRALSDVIVIGAGSVRAAPTHRWTPGHVDRPSAQALADQLTRVLRPEGAVLGFFGTAQPRDTQYTKFIIADDTNLKHRTYPATRGRQTILLNRDIIRLFSGLRVSDSFLMKNNIREILFRKPA